MTLLVHALLYIINFLISFSFSLSLFLSPSHSISLSLPLFLRLHFIMLSLDPLELYHIKASHHWYKLALRACLNCHHSASHVESCYHGDSPTTCLATSLATSYHLIHRLATQHHSATSLVPGVQPMLSEEELDRIKRDKRWYKTAFAALTAK